jgi:hypothetical protein
MRRSDIADSRNRNASVDAYRSSLRPITAKLVTVTIRHPTRCFDFTREKVSRAPKAAVTLDHTSVLDT